jgi:putative tryptophan/tyrosine transport system substrate-binding protein
MSTRRDFITLLGGAAAAWPLAARAQQQGMPVIGMLNSSTPAPFVERMAAFHRGLKEGGYVEGGNLVIEYRWAEGHEERLAALAADLVRHQVKVIAGLNSTSAALAAMAATTTIPIVFTIGGDPIKNHLVSSFNHPGGNATGVSFMTNELGPKRLGILHELLPNASTVAALVNPENPNAQFDVADLEAAARSMELALNASPVRNARDIDAFFATLIRQRTSAFITAPDPLFTTRHEQIVALAAYNRIPGIYEQRIYTDAGGLISYAPDITEAYHQTGIYVSRILKGEKPAELPVIQPTKFELVINLKTAKELGLSVPPTLLALADEVIEQ